MNGETAEGLGDGGSDTVLGVNCSVPLTRRGHNNIESEESVYASLRRDRTEMQ